MDTSIQDANEISMQLPVMTTEEKHDKLWTHSLGFQHYQSIKNIQVSSHSSFPDDPIQLESP